jgi:hypothetical protein
MNDLCVCKKGVGFAIVASLTATVALTTTAQGVGLDVPTGGANCSTISILPFSDTGDTTGLDCAGAGIADDFVATCPYAASTSPDVFYNIVVTPGLDAADGTVDGFARLDLIGCETAYDNQLYVLDSSFIEVACVDDACTNAAGVGFRAQIIDVGLDLANPAGPEYFICVDGWQGDAGVYSLFIDVTAGPCEVVCVNTEGEGTITANGQACVDDDSLEADGIADDPDDSGVNDDCATTSSSIACNATACGTSGTYTGNAACVTDADCGATPDPGDCDLVSGTCSPVFVFRDLDFYALTVPTDGAIVTVRMTAEFTLNYFLFGPAFDCADLAATQIFGLAGVGACVESSATVTGVDAGDYMILATSTFAAAGRAACGANYELSVDCEVECPTDLNGDNSTGFADLTTLLNAWGPCPTI